MFYVVFPSFRRAPHLFIKYDCSSKERVSVIELSVYNPRAEEKLGLC